MKNLICWLFGHQPSTGWKQKEGYGYFRVGTPYTDGINRQHCSLTTECERCGVEYQVGKIHLPSTGELK